MNNIRFKKKGFTLIELLIVCGVISVLATIITASFIQSQAKSRDSRRRADLETVSQAVIMFRSEYNTLPGKGKVANSTITNVLFSDASSSSQFISDISQYMPSLPHDPSANKTGVNDYYYFKNATKYYVYSMLEIKNDPAYKVCKIPANLGQNTQYQYAVPSQDYASGANCF